MGLRKLKNGKCLCSITARAVVCSYPDTDLLPLALCQSTSSKWSPALGESALILISMRPGFYALVLTVINASYSYLYIASLIASGSYRWAGDWKQKQWNVMLEWQSELGLKTLPDKVSVTGAGCHISQKLACPPSVFEVLFTHLTPHHFRQLLLPKALQLSGCQEYSWSYFRALKTLLAFRLFEPNLFLGRRTSQMAHQMRYLLQQQDTSMQHRDLGNDHPYPAKLEEEKVVWTSPYCPLKVLAHGSNSDFTRSSLCLPSPFWN